MIICNKLEWNMSCCSCYIMNMFTSLQQVCAPQTQTQVTVSGPSALAGHGHAINLYAPASLLCPQKVPIITEFLIWHQLA